MKFNPINQQVGALNVMGVMEPANVLCVKAAQKITKENAIVVEELQFVPAAKAAVGSLSLSLFRNRQSH